MGVGTLCLEQNLGDSGQPGRTGPSPSGAARQAVGWAHTQPPPACGPLHPQITCIEWAPIKLPMAEDGKACVLASGSTDNKVRLWRGPQKLV